MEQAAISSRPTRPAEGPHIISAARSSARPSIRLLIQTQTAATTRSRARGTFPARDIRKLATVMIISVVVISVVLVAAAVAPIVPLHAICESVRPRGVSVLTDGSATVIDAEHLRVRCALNVERAKVSVPHS